MLTIFTEALRETLLILIAATLFSIFLAGPISGLLVIAKTSSNKLIRAIAYSIVSIWQTLNYVPFLIVVLLMYPVIQHPMLINIPNFLTAAIPLSIVGSIVLSVEIFKSCPDHKNELVLMAHRYNSSRINLIKFVIWPKLTLSLNSILNNVMLLLVGLTTIEGAIGFGGIGQLILSENIESYNPALLFMAIVAFIAISIFIDYTFRSFNTVEEKG